jgi:hypothetical protein
VSKFGRLEAKVKFATAHTVSATNSVGGPSTVTIAAGSYYPTDLLTEFATQLNASRASGWTVSGAFTEGGTGLVTIHCTNVNWSITWTSTTLRDLLGFTGNISAVSVAQTGTNAMKGVWLPDCPISIEDDATVGAYLSDLRQSISPTGSVLSLVGNTYRRHRNVSWSHVSKARARATATTTMAYEAWFYDTQMGGNASFAAGSRVALYVDATTPTLLGYYQLADVNTTDMDQSVQGWAGRWKVSLPTLIYQAAG